MKLKSFALGGAAIVGLALTTLPAVAYTHHPATPAENAQTDQLNAQALQQAQAGASTSASNTSASNTAASDMSASTQSSSPTQMSSAAAAPSGTVALSSIANPPQTLVNASVETAQGQAVGAVQKVVTGSDGKAQALDVSLLGNQSKIVAIDASQLSYDQTRNVVVAQLSADQIQALPAAPQG